MMPIKTCAGTSIKVLQEGNLNERFGYTKDQLNNQMKTGVKGVLTTAAIGGATYAATKSSKVNSYVGKVLTQVANSETFKKLAPKAKEVLTKLNKLPGSTKAIALAGTALAAIATYGISKEGAYNAGAIDQKYSDKVDIRRKIEE